MKEMDSLVPFIPWFQLFLQPCRDFSLELSLQAFLVFQQLTYLLLVFIGWDWVCVTYN